MGIFSLRKNKNDGGAKKSISSPKDLGILTPRELVEKYNPLFKKNQTYLTEGEVKDV